MTMAMAAATSSVSLTRSRNGNAPPPPIFKPFLLFPTKQNHSASASRFSTKTLRLRRSIDNQILEAVRASTSDADSSSGGDDVVVDLLEGWEVKDSSPGTSFLAKLAIALGIAATVTLISICAKWSSSGSSYGLPLLLEGSSQPAVSPVGFTLSMFGHQMVIPEYTPGWVYFWLLMAAGCGLFISEEALNVWVCPFYWYLLFNQVGISLARSLTLNGDWQAFALSFSRNSPYIISTVLWVYWGVCISDMIPFYLGRFFGKTKASENICSKLGIDKEKAVKITQVVRKYGNLIGIVERFSVGVRNPTAFLAGAWGISSECFFAGVCVGGLFTLPVQLAVGFLLREQPAVALASVATVVGVWTVFPYLVAASTALFLFIRQKHSN